MKKAVLMVLTAALAIALCACGAPKPAADTPDAGPTGEQAAGNPGNTAGVEIGENIIYCEQYKLQSDPGDGLSAYDAAAKVVDETKMIWDYASGDKVTITLTGLGTVDGAECYLYTLIGANGYESRYAANYEDGRIYVFLDMSGEYELYSQ